MSAYAFPRPLPNAEMKPDEAMDAIARHAGMTLRDYFAAKAMTSLLTENYTHVDEDSALKKSRRRLYDVSDREQASSVAWLSYRMADAMLEARLLVSR